MTALTADRIHQLGLQTAARGPGNYWLVTKPRLNLKLTGAEQYVKRNFPNAQGIDRFVYWPDSRVAGTIRDIVNTFRNAGITSVQVGGLYLMTNGQFGQPPGYVPLSEQVVAANSFDPLNSYDIKG